MNKRAALTNSRNLKPAESSRLQLEHGGVQGHVLPRHHGVHGGVDRTAEQLHLCLQLRQPEIFASLGDFDL